MLDRELRQVRAKVLPNIKRETLQSEILNNVTPFARVYTDEAGCYEGLAGTLSTRSSITRRSM